MADPSLRPPRVFWLGAAVLGLTGFAFLAVLVPAARAQSAPAACPVVIEGEIAAKWIALGGARGPLGCPTARAQATPASSQGSRGQEAFFAGPPSGAIVQHTIGPYAGQTFAVLGCIFRTWFQFGGPSGWLGYPIADVENRPDGERQAFEGGDVFHQRAGEVCAAERSSEVAAPPTPQGARSRLDLFQDNAGHTFALASASSAKEAADEGLAPVATLAFVYADQAPGLEPLNAYVNPATGEHDTAAAAESEREDLAAGFVFDGVQGYVLTDPAPGAIALKRFVHGGGGALLTATAEQEAQAAAKGYRFVRIEAYAPGSP